MYYPIIGLPFRITPLDYYWITPWIKSAEFLQEQSSSQSQVIRFNSLDQQSRDKRHTSLLSQLDHTRSKYLDLTIYASDAHHSALTVRIILLHVIIERFLSLSILHFLSLISLLRVFYFSYILFVYIVISFFHHGYRIQWIFKTRFGNRLGRRVRNG